MGQAGKDSQSCTGANQLNIMTPHDTNLNRYWTVDSEKWASLLFCLPASPLTSSKAITFTTKWALKIL